MQCDCYLLPFHKIKYHNVVFIFFLSIYWVQLHMTSSYGNPSLHMTCQGYCIWSLIKMNKQFAHPWHKNIKISVTSKCRVALHFVFISLQIIWFIFYSWCWPRYNWTYCWNRNIVWNLLKLCHILWSYIGTVTYVFHSCSIYLQILCKDTAHDILIHESRDFLSFLSLNGLEKESERVE